MKIKVSNLKVHMYSSEDPVSVVPKYLLISGNILSHIIIHNTSIFK